jgi:hypothetical protein
MHNIHDQSGPILFHTRWTMSYLRGPLTRQQIRTLMDSRLRALQMGGGYSPPQQPSFVYAAEPAAPPVVQPPPTSLGAPPATLPGDVPPALPESTGQGTAVVKNPSVFRPFSQSARQVEPPAAPPDFATTPPTRPPVEQVYQTPAQPATGGIGGSTMSLTQKGPNLPEGYGAKPPVLSASKAQFYLPTVYNVQQAIRTWEQRMGFEASSFGGSQLLYRPMLLAQVVVRYLDRKTGAEDDQRWAFHVPNVEPAGFVRWSDYQATPIDPAQVSQEPYGEAYYGTPSSGLTDSKRMTALRNELIDYVYRSAALTVFYNRTLDVYGTARESRRDFLLRAQQLSREQRDREIDEVTAKFDAALLKLEERLKKELRELGGDQQAVDELKREDLYTTGEAIMSLLRGRTTYTLSRMSRARRYKKQAQESLYSTEQMIHDLENQIEAKQNELQEALRVVKDKWAKEATTAEEVKITPLKKDIALEIFGIGWIPSWYAVLNGQPVILPAYPNKQSS